MHHQGSVAEVTELLYEREFYYPYLDTSMRALPHHYRDIVAEENDCIMFTVKGDGGGTWYLIRENDQLNLTYDCEFEPVCTVVIEGDIAWRMFTKGISKSEAENGVQITGRHQLGRQIFYLLAVMA
jgi:hypothetical protein